ncbi:MAG: pitrilysin family protein [Gammaproteobacteria bacterium]|nr:pitrilysin family protein [Gammaproteobacteria bacterium]
MKKLLILVLVLLTGNVLAAPKIQHWVTDNGVRVYFFPADALPMMDMRIVFDAGAARDGDKHGLALLTNGLLSEGAGEWNTGQIAGRFDGVGASFSNSSHRDMSVLSLRSLTQKDLLDQALETFKVVLTQPTFPEDAFERERKRLLIGLEQQKQSPDDIASKAFYKALFVGHPYGHMPSGEIETVKTITRDDLKAFYDKYFVAKNAVVALVGDLTREQAEQIVKQVTGDLKAGEAAPALPAVNDLAKAENIDIDFPSTQSHILVGIPGVKRGDKDYFPLYVGNHVLGGSGLVSILSDEIREKRGLVYSSYSYFIPMHERGPFILGLQTKNKSAKEALTVLNDVLKKFVAEGPTKQQLEAARKNLTGGFALQIASNGKIVEQLASIGFYGLPLDYLDQYIANVDAVTLQQVKDAFKRRVDPDKMLTVLVGDKSQSQN